LRTKLIPSILALVVVAALGLTASAGARGAAETNVTIRENSGDFHGKVKSSKQSCVDERKVALYKQKGHDQMPSQDKKVASDSASSNGEWSTGNTGFEKGKFYARAKAISGCQGDNSETVKV
jgi:hypothetical protein